MKMRQLEINTGELLRKLRLQFFEGILIVVPVVVATLIVIWIFSTIDNILQPIIKRIAGEAIIGAGFGLTALLIYLAGVIASTDTGQRIIRSGESFLTRIPVYNLFYGGIKQVVLSFSEPRQTGFLQVVLVDFPRKGTRAIGFVTREYEGDGGKKMLNVFVPTAPNPTSGFLEMLPEEEITRTSISVDDAIKMVVSAGKMTSPGAMKQILS
ncbi:MAG: DUF502 domain-containing protein [Dehalococcoidales bacterium]|nr:DUF502 domain-containing protein [Dehalococcoidales bacterium]